MDYLEMEKENIILPIDNESSNDIFDSWDEDFQSNPIHNLFQRPQEGEECIACSG